MDPSGWSLGVRRAVAGGLILLVGAGIAAWLLLIRGAESSSPAAASTTPSAAVSASTVTASVQQAATTTLSAVAAAAPQAGPTGPPAAGGVTPSSAEPPTADVAPAGRLTIAMPFTDDQITNAAAVAASWIEGVSAIRHDEDQAARTARLAAYLTDPDDPALRRWLAPSEAALADLTANQTVIEATAAVTRVDTMTPTSLLLEVQTTQNTSNVTDPGKATISTWIVTVTPAAGDTWTVSALIGAGDGDPGD